MQEVLGERVSSASLGKGIPIEGSQNIELIVGGSQELVQMGSPGIYNKNVVNSVGKRLR